MSAWFVNSYCSTMMVDLLINVLWWHVSCFVSTRVSCPFADVLWSWQVYYWYCG